MPITLLDNNRPIYYDYHPCENKDAETILLVHGLGLDMNIWTSTVKLLQPYFHVLRYNLPGHGSNQKDYRLTKWTWEFLSRELESILDELHISMIHFVGYGGGGNFGLELASAGKPYLKSLVLISTPIFYPQELGEKELSRRMKMFMKEKNDLVDILVNSLFYYKDEKKISNVKNMYETVNEDAYIKFYKLCGESVLNYTAKTFNSISVPICNIVGEYDPIYPPKLHLLDMKYLNKDRFLIVPNSSNAIMMDQADLLAHWVRDFVEKVIGENNIQPPKTVFGEKLADDLQFILEAAVHQLMSKKLIEVSVVSPFDVKIDGKSLNGKWNQRKAKQLFSYIAIHNNVTREQLFDTFWPDLELNKARNQLRVSLNHIKSLIEEHTGEEIDNYLLIEREGVSLVVRTKVDYLEWLEWFRKVGTYDHIEQHVHAIIDLISSLPDPLFPSFYDEWMLEARSSFESKIVEICEELLDFDITPEQSIDILKLLIKLHPTEELYYDQMIYLLVCEKKDKEIEYYEEKRESIQNN
ncbi:alpha/beta fold hydrolase [Bacillus sp. 2205SS5-2]|uniref:alpha/beta fold hydrolase n=1 Tax=Bacillus sp. 2205SS5-2 TaxID=3109031 RepID=UPI0030045F81